jgi:hypothetical protein
MKLIKTIITIFLIVLVVLVLGRNMIVKLGAEIGTKAVLGIGMHIDKVNIGLFDSTFHIKGLKVYNPKGFEERLMVDLPELLIDYNLKDIIGGTIHLEHIIFHLERVNIVKNENGATNLDVFKPKEGAKPAPEKKDEPKKPAKMPDIKIDLMDLKIGEIVFINYAKKDTPAINAVKINLDEQYKNVTDPKIIGTLLVGKIFQNIAVSQITGFDIGGLQSTMVGALGSVDDVALKALGSAKDLSAGALSAGKDVTSGALKTVEGVGATAGQAADEAAKKAEALAKEASDLLKAQSEKLKGLTDKVKLPFGKE